ncbi:mannitol-1-phosphate 5-dehydrogenase [Frondihabitans sp. Leaf304]|uniref:mannitol-1-phosphate 5-dehydrogenase n=1 Tax=Frondihabitans sp. Leaf304 TaxID=1736329 RepID=UPI0006F75BFA|nr:mannitol-1-phosphate 5-dehydrogenase [Frondihabitans sp. Leaf304]KQQ27847.1 mannitol-1-phosphate 5-dehydrogenase [Frondihabitans sp. Leaf304]
MVVSKKAVHFGAGNIGRGFIGQYLQASGYEVVFADVNTELVRTLNSTPSYDVHAIGGDSDNTTTVSGYRAIDNRLDEAGVVHEISTADIVTTSVGPRILPSLASLLARGLAQRPAHLPPLTVIACETAIGASSTLAAVVGRIHDHGEQLVRERAVFANCEIDRIVPEQTPGLDVTIESFAEWIVDRGAFGDAEHPTIDGVTWVDDLEPFIERKLFTVNTAHAAAAYYGWSHGIASIREALAAPDVHSEVLSVLAETKTLLVAKYGLDPAEQQAYIDRNLERIADPHLPDTTGRVGRNPLSKVSRHERLVGPAAQLAERGLPFDALVRAVRAALDFDVPDDVESRELQSLLRSGAGAPLLAETLTGVFPGHPLFPALVDAVADRVAARVPA